MPRSAGVERSKTSSLPIANTLDSDFIKLISPRMAEPMSAGLTRKQTQITPARPSPNATIGGQSLFRDSSKRRPGATSAQGPKGAYFRLNKSKYRRFLKMRWPSFTMITWVPMTGHTLLRLCHPIGPAAPGPLLPSIPDR
jgi:hypothetical protein